MKAKRENKRTKRAGDLTAAESANVRTALKFLRTRCGGWDGVASALAFARTSLTDTAHGRIPPSASMAIRIARIAGTTIDDVLAGRFPAVGACPYCGHCPTPTGEPAAA